MNILQALHTLLSAQPQQPQAGGHQTHPLFQAAAQHQAPQQQAPQLQPHSTGANELSVGQNRFSANLGIPYGDPTQGGQFNPGLTPMQGSHGYGTNPQSRAYSEGWDTSGQVNPQNNHNQQYWLQ